MVEFCHEDQQAVQETHQEAVQESLQEAVQESVQDSLQESVQHVSNASVDVSSDYFYSEGLNEEGVEMVIEEVGLEDFLEFVTDPIEELNEARAARKAKSNAPSYEKVKAAVDKSDAAKKAAKKK